jgi:hypothetical protein
MVRWRTGRCAGLSRQARGALSFIHVFGENRHDIDSIRHLLLHLKPELSGRVKVHPKRPSLTKTAGRAAVTPWVEAIRQVVEVQTRAGKPARAVLVHRDADGPDPDGLVQQRLRQQLKSVPADPVVPVQMTEAWWFLFPDAVEAVNPRAWCGVMPRRPRDVEAISGPKKELQRLTRKARREYGEGDSPAIAEQVRKLKLNPVGRSRSFDRFAQLAKELA